MPDMLQASVFETGHEGFQVGGMQRACAQDGLCEAQRLGAGQTVWPLAHADRAMDLVPQVRLSLQQALCGSFAALPGTVQVLAVQADPGQVGCRTASIQSQSGDWTTSEARSSRLGQALGVST